MNRRSESIGIAVIAVVVLAVLAVMFIGSGDGSEGASPDTDPRSELTVREEGNDTQIVYDRLIDVDDLPAEAIDTLLLIDDGGPYPYDKDGSTFQNREGLLPGAESGYYREYTVDTPGSNDRGARRIVAGDAGEYFYTDDHYDSFRQVTGW